MKRKTGILLSVCFLLTAAAALPAMAAEKIDSVYLALVDEDKLYELGPGSVYTEDYPLLLTGDDICSITDYFVSNAQDEPKKSFTATIEIRADDGWEFTGSTVVGVYGAYDVEVTRRTNRRIVARVKSYPVHVLGKVDGIKIDESAKEASWNEVPYARSYSVYISYTDKNDNPRRVRKTASSNHLNIGSYLDKYGEVQISVKAVKGSTSADRFIAESGYVDEGGSPDEELDETTFRFNIPTAYSDGTSKEEHPVPGGASGPGNGSSGSSGSSGPGLSGWQGGGESWYYIQNGARVTGWLSFSPEEWYLFDAAGNMLYGLQNMGGQIYYLNTVHDGTFGKMLSGLQVIGGQTYYFNQIHDGTFGAMYVNRRIPDGRFAGVDGVVR